MLSRSLRRAGSAGSFGLAVIVLLVTAGLGGEAQAQAKVNWSEYIEPAGGSRPLTRTTPNRPTKSATAKAKPSRATKQQRAKQSRTDKRANKRANKRSVRNGRRR